MSEEKIYELKRDIWTPAIFIKAGIRKTEKEWKDKLGDFSMGWQGDWFIDLSEPRENKVDELNELINSVFSSMGLNSLSYKAAAREIAETWLKQNK